MKQNKEVELKVVGTPNTRLPDGSPHPALANIARLLAKQAVKEFLAAEQAELKARIEKEKNERLLRGDQESQEEDTDSRQPL